jgi:hypothetical protein
MPARHRTPAALPALLAAAVVGTTGCFAVADLDRFEFGACPPLPIASRTSFEYALTSFDPHANPERPQKLEIAVFDDAERPVAKVVYAPLLAGNVSGRLRDCLPPGTGLTVEFWADLDQNGEVSAPDADHSWVDCLEVAPDGAVRLAFEHNTDFRPLRLTTVDVPDRFDFFMRFVNVPFVARTDTTFVFEITERSVARPVVARYFLTGAPRGEAEVRITDILRADQSYDVDVWVDRVGGEPGVKEPGEPALAMPVTLTVADDGTYPIDPIDVGSRFPMLMR